mmetsp:Transcript_101084/g.261793  ORF Transcript_101084/g.261793 Transcript_101084/m.261793 type:complete len:218 (+) Transcript_101084:580-1233(+)
MGRERPVYRQLAGVHPEAQLAICQTLYIHLNLQVVARQKGRLVHTTPLDNQALAEAAMQEPTIEPCSSVMEAIALMDQPGLLCAALHNPRTSCPAFSRRADMSSGASTRRGMRCVCARHPRATSRRTTVAATRSSAAHTRPLTGLPTLSPWVQPTKLVASTSKLAIRTTQALAAMTGKSLTSHRTLVGRAAALPHHQMASSAPPRRYTMAVASVQSL